jgi:hypothetical protein
MGFPLSAPRILHNLTLSVVPSLTVERKAKISFALKSCFLNELYCTLYFYNPFFKCIFLVPQNEEFTACFVFLA